VRAPAIRFPGGRPWGWAALWGMFLGPMFFSTYIAALELTAMRAHVPTLVFSWERHIPFWAWTVVPYWSEDLFYGLSLFVCRTRRELNTHAWRLVLAQAIAIPIFLLLPLRLTIAPPADTGIWQPWFDALGDVVGRPYNLAPSLHITIVLILGAVYVRHVPWPWRAIVYVWGFLIGLSTLTAYQHHVFDIPTGALLGVFCMWALPEGRPSPFRGVSWTSDGRRLRLGAAYGLGAVLLTALAFGLGGWAWWLLWPATSVAVVSSAYLALGPGAFGKDERGRMDPSARWLLAPYLVAARINAWAFTRRLQAAEVAPGVRLGRVAEGSGAASVLDLTAELPAPAHDDWRCLPGLDLVAPSPERLRQGARHVEERVAAGSDVLVCCALGFSRSAAVVATWLVTSGRAADVDDAIARVRAVRPVVLKEASRRAIEAAVRADREEVA